MLRRRSSRRSSMQRILRQKTYINISDLDKIKLDDKDEVRLEIDNTKFSAKASNMLIKLKQRFHRFTDLEMKIKKLDRQAQNNRHHSQSSLNTTFESVDEMTPLKRW